MEFKDGKVVNIIEGGFPKPYSLSLKDAKKGLTVSNLRKSYLKEGSIAHGVVYNGKIYGPNAIEMLAEQTSIEVVRVGNGAMLKGKLSILEKMMPICLDCKPIGDKPIQFGLPPKSKKR